MKLESCPVCRDVRTALFRSIDGRDYWRCGTCFATFLDRAQLPDREAEGERYRQHQNRADDP
ncbi:MAG: methyltransferase type 12, partial [bacterium]